MTKTQDDDVQFTTMTTTDEGHDHESRPRPQQRQQNDGNNNSYYYNYNYDNYSYNCKQRHQCIDMLWPTFCFFRRYEEEPTFALSLAILAFLKPLVGC